MSHSVVIVGAGQAAAQTVASLRSEGFTGDITLIGEEPYLPYQRPPLSKAYLAGELALERLFIKPEEFYTEAKCTLLLGTTATAIDRAKSTLTTSDGRSIPYETLVLATGSRVRHVPIPGGELPGGHDGAGRSATAHHQSGDHEQDNRADRRGSPPLGNL